LLDIGHSNLNSTNAAFSPQWPEQQMSAVPNPIKAPPNESELNDRLARVRALMAEKDLDYYVSFDPVNVYFLTNFANYVHERPFLLVIEKQGPPTMLAPLLELTHVKMRAQCDLEYVTYYEFPAPDGENWYDIYPTLFEKNSRVGIESAMPVGIARKTPGTVTMTDVIDEARLVKSEYEIGRTAHACSIVDLGHATLLEICKPGVPEGAIYSAVSGAMTKQIFEDIPNANLMITKSAAFVWPPTIGHDPHHFPSLTMPMEKGGPHVSIVLAQVDGYGVELERTFFLGDVPGSAKKPFEVMTEARAKAFAMLKPGQHLGEIDEAVRKVLIDAGYEDAILHRTGHGFGITGHEAPYLAIGETRLLEPGMTVSIEPGIYREGEGGFRHSDTVLITEDGYVCLTHAPDTLDELVLPV
jgi:Xaa-Pro dipeptidase